MKVKFDNKWYDVLDTRTYFGIDYLDIKDFKEYVECLKCNTQS